MDDRDTELHVTRYYVPLFVDLYNCRRLHQSHEYQTPDEVYYATNTGTPLAIAA